MEFGSYFSPTLPNNFKNVERFGCGLSLAEGRGLNILELDPKAKYEISGATVSPSSTELNQNIFSSFWEILGRYHFPANAKAEVKLTSSGEGKHGTSADAVKFVQVNNGKETIVDNKDTFKGKDCDKVSKRYAENGNSLWKDSHTLDNYQASSRVTKKKGDYAQWCAKLQDDAEYDVYVSRSKILSEPRVTVAGYKPQFDYDRRLWFIDVVINPVPSYNCFIRLALVRYQPNSLKNAELSSVVRADFSQLVPDRSVTVMRDPLDRKKRTLIIQVFGTPNPTREFSWQCEDTEEDLVRLGGNQFEVKVYKPLCKEMGDLSWEIDSDISFSPEPSKNGALLSGKLLWKDPTGKFTGKRRLVIREYERFTSDEQGAEQCNGRSIRLIYSDVLEV